MSTQDVRDRPEWAYGHRADEPANPTEAAILTILDQAADRDEDTILTAHRIAAIVGDLFEAAQAFVSHLDGPEPRHGLWATLKADREAIRAALAAASLS